MHRRTNGARERLRGKLGNRGSGKRSNRYKSRQKLMNPDFSDLNIRWKLADKPGSVVGNHSSGMCVTTHLKQPTRERDEPSHYSPIWSCSERGLPCHSQLPAVRCALTAPFHPYRYGEPYVGGLLSAALSIGLYLDDFHLPGVTWRSALRSPDFPLHPGYSDCLASFRRQAYPTQPTSDRADSFSAR